ncbi:Hyaluronan synthase [Flavobacterium longum]|uniref:glycosyltransferase family 2 protein n=1 Tax=Flavobacterium longum TaxID=1299340 RepID=UPI0039ECB323
MKTLTVYTPTFNRAYCLGQLYDSLVAQRNNDFKWLIIDDGSSDNTKTLVDSWIAEGKVEIEYYYKPNGGMHTAHNAAYERLNTELNMCIDSDDMVSADAIDKILDFWSSHRADGIGGIYALDEDKHGKIIGQPFPDDLKSFQGWGCKVIIDDNGKVIPVCGDKKFISVTKILKKYPPIPVFEGEKYYSLYYKQHFIERDFRILILNESVCIVEYMPDGSSVQMYRQYVRNPKGFKHLRELMMDMAPVFKIRFTQAIHYINACLILGQWNFFKGRRNWLMVLAAIPFGIALHLLTIYKNRKMVS